MKTVIIKDAVRQVNRTLIENFDGKNEITEKVTSTTSQGFKSIEFKDRYNPI
jgi:hypothetical protein